MDGELIEGNSLASNLANQTWADWFGMAASIGCAIHCAAMPMVIAYLPTLGLSWLADEGFHQWMAAACFCFAAFAFLPGLKKHRSLVPLTLGSVGVLLLSTAAFGLEEGCCPSCADLQEQQIQEAACEDESCTACSVATTAESADPLPPSLASSIVPFLTPLGGVFLVFGHIVNHRRSCQCQGDGCCLSTTDLES